MSDTGQGLAYNNVNAMLDIITRAGSLLDREDVNVENKLLVNDVINKALTKLFININNIKDL